jgi:hypothetical protein
MILMDFTGRNRSPEDCYADDTILSRKKFCKNYEENQK